MLMETVLAATMDMTWLMVNVSEQMGNNHLLQVMETVKTLTLTAIIGIVKLMFVSNALREQFLRKKDALQLMIFAWTGVWQVNAQTAIKDMFCKMENAMLIIPLQLMMEMMMAADAVKSNACNAKAAITLRMENVFQLMIDAELGTKEDTVLHAMKEMLSMNKMANATLRPHQVEMAVQLIMIMENVSNANPAMFMTATQDNAKEFQIPALLGTAKENVRPVLKALKKLMMENVFTPQKEMESQMRTVPKLIVMATA